MDTTAPTPRRGKIARLPARLREQVNRWLHDGESQGQILPKLNAMPEVQAVLAEHFGGEPISPDNLSAWRRGEHQRWLREQERIQETRERARYAAELARASGGSLSEGALAQLTGEVMELVEEIAAARRNGQEINPKLLTAVNQSLVAARAKELETQAHELKVKQLAQRDRELALAEEKFQLQFAEGFLKWFQDARAREIAESKADKTVKMGELVQLIFGSKPNAEAKA